MSNPLPNLLGLTSIADGSAQQAAPIRNNYSAIQTAVNDLIAALSGGASGQVLEAVDASHVQWAGSGMTQICDLTLGASQPSFDTNAILSGNIPATYNHLRIVCQLRGDMAATLDTPAIRFNNDSGGNYEYAYTASQNNAVTGSTAVAQTSGWLGAMTAASAAANYFGISTIDIAAYAQAEFKAYNAKGAAMIGVAATNLLRDISGVWKSTAAINRITILPTGSANFVAGSRFTLYGIT